MFHGDDRIGMIGALQSLECVFGLREDFEPLALAARGDRANDRHVPERTTPETNLGR